ncbi:MULTISPECIES: hypothetical protein [unclassified Methylobacterium]|uniref:hypothetical protein n=1 Tax=unclassified Methylobacterium TaxID=2615210 RepID=UPI0005BA0BF8|nr:MULTISPECIES: hypothetical protein [unclassified Methylobacterium]SFU51850.1 hypothetical protein SAMN02799643_01045 [Methylobacterium sp. UNCCL125]
MEGDNDNGNGPEERDLFGAGEVERANWAIAAVNRRRDARNARRRELYALQRDMARILAEEAERQFTLALDEVE